jgi:hypothetical protein
VIYLLLICGENPPSDGPNADRVSSDEQPSPIEAWLEQTRGVRLLGARLAVPADATTVRKRQGEVILTDGPFAETKEWIAGFDLVECADLDEAIEIASRHPMAEFGLVEIRPLLPADSDEVGADLRNLR